MGTLLVLYNIIKIKNKKRGDCHAKILQNYTDLNSIIRQNPKRCITNRELFSLYEYVFEYFLQINFSPQYLHIFILI